MATLMTIKEFKELSDVEQKKVKKDVLMKILLASNEQAELNDLKEAILSLTEIIKDHKKQSEDNSLKIVELKVELELVKNECQQLKKDLSYRINNLEQRSGNKNIEIVGLRKPNEMETDKSLTMGFLKDVMKANVDVSDIDVLHEVPSRRKDLKRVVIVAFKHRDKRDEILKCKSAVRLYNESLPDQSLRIFVNEQLSPENRRINAMAAKKKRELNYKFLWTKNGASFMRKDGNSIVIKICDEEDLNKVL